MTRTRCRPVIRLNRPATNRNANIRISEIPPSAKTLPKKRVGLLGGSFNPAHDGHRAVSLEAIRHLRLDEVWWLVSPQNPLKSHREMATFEARLASARHMAAGFSKLIVTDLEQRLGTRYTVDTVRRLLRDNKADFAWLIGADNLVQLPKWRSWQDLLNLVPIAVFDREPYSYGALAGRVARAYSAHRIQPRDAAGLVRADPPAWVYFRLRRHPVSSTAIRHRNVWPASLGPAETVLAQGGQPEEQSS
ncbi:MAG: nicotinate-nucleotide adenylyltransferase [Geminicoccaceae bacterium]